ncbi:hypothetical protein H5410_001335, partial [Solanum commersonii]
MALLRREGSIHAIDGKYPDKISDSDKEKIEGDALSMYFEGDKGVEASGLFVRGHTSQHGRSKSKYRSKSHLNKKNAECWGSHKKGPFERDCPMSKSKEK